MPSFNRGDTLTLTLDFDDYITFTGRGTVTTTPSGGSSTSSYLNGTNLTYGPFKNTSTSVVIVCDTAGSYTQSSDGSVNAQLRLAPDGVNLINVNTGSTLAVGGLATGRSIVGSVTLAASDASTIINANSASAVVCTIPNDSTVAWTTDTVISIYQQGAGVCSFAAGAGVTLRQPSSYVASVQFAHIYVQKVGTNEWALL